MRKIRIAIFDTETTGMVKSFKVPVEQDLTNYPYLLQLGVQVLEIDLDNLNEAKLIYNIDTLVQPYRAEYPIEIEEGALKVHGITGDKASLEGIPIDHVAYTFQGIMNSVDFIVAHNYAFDRGVMASELLRLGIQPTGKRGIMAFCTMKYCTNILQLPSKFAKYDSFKFPSLGETYKYYFDENIEDNHNTHNAQGDVDATVRILLNLIMTDKKVLSWFKGEIKNIY